LTNCCHRFSLPTGVIIIGILSSVVAYTLLVINLYDFAIAWVVPSTVSLIVSLLLLFGTFTNRPKFLLPWILQPIIAFVFLGIIIFIFTASFSFDTTARQIKMGIYLAIFCINALVQVYFSLVVKSFYDVLKSEGPGIRNI
jgi:hypothetical protein